MKTQVDNLPSEHCGISISEFGFNGYLDNSHKDTYCTSVFWR